MCNVQKDSKDKGFKQKALYTFTMHFLPKTHEELFRFIQELEGVDPSVKVNVFQNTERFKVDLVPGSVGEEFGKRIE